MTAAGILQERTGQAVCARTGTARPGWGEGTGRAGAVGAHSRAPPPRACPRRSPLSEALTPLVGTPQPSDRPPKWPPVVPKAMESSRGRFGSEDRSFRERRCTSQPRGAVPERAATAKRHAHAPPRHARCLAGVSCFFLKELLKPALAEQHQNAPASQSWVALAEQDTARAEREEEPKPGCGVERPPLRPHKPESGVLISVSIG